MRIYTAIVALFALLGLGGGVDKAKAQIVLAVGFAPPPLPVYVQPAIPGPGYIWTPGYWSWDAAYGDYYWVPGSWVLAPTPGLLWTPGYWGWSGGSYVWNDGYWGPHVGFYGGVSYGFGYTGVGFSGGYWQGGSFFYNKSVTNISNNTTIINNVYNQPVVNNNTTNVSFNGGNGGIKAVPTQEQLQAANEQHQAATQDQIGNQKMASENKQSFASVNKGAPPVAAVAKAGDFSPHNIVAAKAAGGSFEPRGAHPGANPALAAHPNGAGGLAHHDGPFANAQPGAVKTPNAAGRDHHAPGAAKAALATPGGAVPAQPPHPGAHPQAHPAAQQTAIHPQPHPGAPNRMVHTAQPHMMPGPHAQPHPNAPRPPARAQPHPAPKKDQHHS